VSGIPWSHPQQQHQNHTQKPLTCALKLSFTPIEFDGNSMMEAR
jgi:hypothetical protein